MTVPSCSVLEGAAGHGSPLRSGLNLQLRSHASPKLPVQECPMCPYSSDSPLRLEEHINRQHFDLTSPSFPPESPPSRDGVFNCPLCVTSFPNSSDLELHVNIEHKDILRYVICLQLDDAVKRHAISCMFKQPKTFKCRN